MILCDRAGEGRDRGWEKKWRRDDETDKPRDGDVGSVGCSFLQSRTHKTPATAERTVSLDEIFSKLFNATTVTYRHARVRPYTLYGTYSDSFILRAGPPAINCLTN